MVENELVVRLVECAKPLNSVYDSNNPTQILVTGWADTTTVPKRGEICLEYYTNTDSSSANYGKICYRMKIGDGVHKYIEPDPDDSLPYFPLSDDVINLIVEWVNTHLNVSEYAQASYDNTNHTLKVYSISEQYGKIGHLADGTATPSLDVEVTFAAGTKINLASVDNTLTITHEATTRSDTGNTTNLAFEDNVVTGVTTDATGHITGITTYKLPANPVSAASGTTNQIMISDGDNTTSTSGKTITTTAPDSNSTDTTLPTSKAVNDAIDTKINTLDGNATAEDTGTGLTVITEVTETDGIVSSKKKTVEGADKITVTSTANSKKITIDHDDTTRSDTTNTTNLSFGDSVVTGVTSDTTGHVTGITTYKLPENPNTDNTTLTNGTTTAKISSNTGLTLTGSAGKFNVSDGTNNFDVNVNSVSAASGTSDQIMVSDGDNTTSTSGVKIDTTAPTSTSTDTTVPTSKAVDTAITTAVNALDGSVSADTNKVLTGVTEVDGVITNKTDVAYTTIAPVQDVTGDGTWTTASTSNNTITISHAGPNTSSTSAATATAGTAPGFGGNVLTGVTIDSKGHVTGVTTGALPSNPVSGLEGTATDTDSGITVQVESTGGEVDGVNVTVSLDTLKSSLGLTGALIPKGTLGTGGTITSLPTASSSNLGWAYKVITDGTYSGIAAKVGDVIYCIEGSTSGTYEWSLIPSGDESFTDTWRNIKINGTEKLGTGISTGALDIVNGNNTTVTWNGTAKTLQVDHDTSTVTAGTYGPTADVTGNEGNTIKVPEITVDTYGHVTGVTERTYTSKNTTYTASGTNGVTASVDSSNVVNVAGVDATTSAKGVVQLTDGYSSTDDTLAATGKSIKAAIDGLDVNSDKGAASIANGSITIKAVQQEDGLIKDGGSTTINYEGTYNAINNKLATQSTVSDAIDALDVTTDKGSAAISGSTLTIKAVQQEDGKIKDGGTTTVNLEGTYDASTNKIATQSTVTNAIEALDVTAVSLNGNEHITSISETDGKISVSKDTIQSASTTQSGITQFVTDIHYSDDETKTANAKQIWDECEKRNVQFVKSGIIPVPQPYDEETFINSFAYGVKWRHDTSTVYSVGNSEYIRTKPVHNSLRACVYKINYVSGGFDVTETVGGTSYTIHYGARREFLYWLDDNNWNKKADGTASVLDGTGDTGIAIYHPAFYGKSFTQEENGNTWHYVYVSPIKYDDTWETIKEGYTDFAKATIVDGKARCYTGALPSVSTARMRMNDCALASGGHQMSYDEYKWLFYWLPVIDFKTFEIESNDTPTTWSWGSDIVDRDSLTGSSIPTYGYPMLYSGSTLGYNYITSGYTNALGTHTGWVKYTSESYTVNVLPIVRWRGFEIQRCNWTNVQGCWGEQTSSTDTIFATKNRALFSAYKNPNGYNAPYGEWGCIVAQSAPTTELDVTAQITKETWSLDSTDGLWKSTTYQVKDKNIRYVGDHVGGWINEFALNSCGDIVANNTSTSTKYDYSYTYATTTPGYYNNPRCLRFGGRADDGSNGGPGYLSSGDVASHALGNIAFRVCWNIDEYTSVMN